MPITPRLMMRMSLVTHTCQGNTQSQWMSCRTRQNTKMERRGGKIRARPLLATAPIRDMRSPRSGTKKAMIAAWERREGEGGERERRNTKNYYIFLFQHVKIFTNLLVKHKQLFLTASLIFIYLNVRKGDGYTMV